MTIQKTEPKKAIAGRRPKAPGVALSTRADILHAARGVFARNGFNGTSIREVAEEAQVNKAMIYYHFSDKLELYRAVLKESFTEFDRIWEDTVFRSSTSVRERLAKYIEELVRFQQKNDEIRRIMSMEFASSGSNYEWMAKNIMQYSYRQLHGLMTEGMRSGELKKMDPVLAISSLFGMVIHAFFVHPIAVHVTGKSLDLSTKRLSSFIAELYFNGMATKNTNKPVHPRSKGL